MRGPTLTRATGCISLSLLLACGEAPEAETGESSEAEAETEEAMTFSGGSESGGSESESETGAEAETDEPPGPAMVDEDGPLGAYFDDDGHLQLAVRSTAAERVEAWLYAEAWDAPELLRVVLELYDGDIFRAVVSSDELDAAGLGAGAAVLYGLRAWGPGWRYDEGWTPGSELGFEADVDAQGNRFNPNKLLWDPYALELSHDPRNAQNLDGAVYLSGDSDRARDSAGVAPKGVVLRDADVDVDPGAKPGLPLRDQIIYEVHLRGLTRGDTSLPEELRGTYLGAAEKAAYLADLGVTAVEFLPLHETQNQQNDLDPESADGDNYWGYSTLNFFAPDRRFAVDKGPGGPTRELKQMVAAFHEVGIAVLVDVVYNHTGEGGSWGDGGAQASMYSWRGLDNVGYYQLGGETSGYQNDNGVGPNLASHNDIARDIVIDSLRYWSEELGVDGFRFDLTPILANGCEAGCFQFDPDDPQGILRRAADEVDAFLIAEPWGTGAGTYQAGNFPAGWAEWNDTYRNTIRDDQNRLGIASVSPAALADRFSGSYPFFGDDGRPPWASINFIVAHDGMTLRDLYACNEKNNLQAWPWGPSDGGTNDDRAWDQGGDPAAQRQAARTGLALMMISAGVPMITGGDELYRTQQCNNNPYNLDSPAMWLDWSGLDTHADFHAFARGIMRFRGAHPSLRPELYRPLSDGDQNGLDAITFLRDDGVEADAGYLDNANNHFLALRIDGEEGGDDVRSIYVAYNGWEGGIDASLPTPAPGYEWVRVADTSAELEDEGNVHPPGEEVLIDAGSYFVRARSLVILVEEG